MLRITRESGNILDCLCNGIPTNVKGKIVKLSERAVIKRVVSVNQNSVLTDSTIVFLQMYSAKSLRDIMGL